MSDTSEERLADLAAIRERIATLSSTSEIDAIEAALRQPWRDEDAGPMAVGQEIMRQVADLTDALAEAKHRLLAAVL